MPSLSIVVPVYNAEQYLEACIDSVLSQSYQDFELILVDDGSTDHSGDICDEYAGRDGRIVVVHQMNQGQSAARNRGLESACGDYVGFCDNDDVLQANMFDVLIRNMISGEADVSACSYAEQYADGRRARDSHTGDVFYYSNREAMAEYLSRKKMDIYVWTKIYKRELLQRYHISFESGRNDEDFLFNHQVFLNAERVVFTDQALYTYQVREVSESRIYFRKNLRRYLHNTLYRTYKIEAVTRERYPDLLILAKRQTIIYDIMMLGRVVGLKEYWNSEPYFSYIMRYLKHNKKQLIRERGYWGMSLPGVCMLAFLPPVVYYKYRRLVAGVK